MLPLTKLILALCGLAIAVAIGIGIYRWLRQTPPQVTTGPGLPVVVQPAVSENHPSVPAPKKQQAGTLVIIKKPTTVDAKPETVKVHINVNPRETPPSVFADSGRYEISWTPVRDPWLEIEWGFQAGADLDMDAVPSPFVGLSIIQAFGKANLGIGTDLSGAGPFVSYEVLPNLNLLGVWKPLHYRESSSFAVGLTYSF